MKKINFYPVNSGSKFTSSFKNFFGKDFITFLSIYLLKTIKYMNLMNIRGKYVLNALFWSVVIKK
jgi:hypothetical protein